MPAQATGAYTNMFVSKDQIGRIIDDDRVRGVLIAGLQFGGVKNSGCGRELSSAGIQEFFNEKPIRVA